MRNDDVKMQVQGDSLTIKFGSVLLRKLGHTRVPDISQRMRQLGRLKLQLRKDLKTNDSSKLQLVNCITGTGFDSVIKAVENLCGIEIDAQHRRRSVQKPSLALKLGHSLAKLAQMKKGAAIRNNDNTMRQEAEAFASLHESDFTDLISTVALKTLSDKKYNRPEVLPLTEDLVKLKIYEEKLLRELTSELQTKQDYNTYRRLLEVVLSRITIFNKRRGGEASSLLLSAYTEPAQWHKTANTEILNSLQPLERKLFQRLDMVQLPGKRGRRVPMLITQDVKLAMDILVASRDTVGVPTRNPYFFATQSAYGYLDSWRVMTNMANAAGLKRPELITTTALRKYVSTVAQIVALEKGELEWLANHLGHDLKIHKDFYRLHESVVELSKVSRLLLAVDSGRAAQYSGKSLGDVLPHCDTDVEPDDTDNEDIDDIDESLAATVATTQTKKSPAAGLAELKASKLLKRSKNQIHDDTDDGDEAASDWAASQSIPSTSKRRAKGPPAVGLAELKASRLLKRTKNQIHDDTDDGDEAASDWAASQSIPSTVCCLLGPLLCIVSFHCYVCCLLVVLVKLSVLAK